MKFDTEAARHADGLVEVLALPRHAHDPARRRRDDEHVDERELPVVEERLPDDRAAFPGVDFRCAVA